MSDSKNATEAKRSRKFFDALWKKIIRPEIGNLAALDGVKQRKGSYKRIWDAYKSFNLHCSFNYMAEPTWLLDRHKVAACYMYAILAAQPLAVDQNVVLGSRPYYANEMLAVTVGCTILCGFVTKAIDDAIENKLLCLEEKRLKQVCERIKIGVNFKDDFPALHDDYYGDVLRMLCATQAEARYNILAMSIIVYHWESALIGDPELFRAIIKAR